mmetsp:Transcript_3935/g.5409  ORF Transcript_3935/g.5409 Transcript_3935/m.5409 type:complete len:135 (+) Transcript_3935:819-1223(+)
MLLQIIHQPVCMEHPVSRRMNEMIHGSAIVLVVPFRSLQESFVNTRRRPTVELHPTHSVQMRDPASRLEMTSMNSKDVPVNLPSLDSTAKTFGPKQIATWIVDRSENAAQPQNATEPTSACAILDTRAMSVRLE